MTRDEATSLLLKCMFDGLVGKPSGKCVTYSLLEEKDSRFSFVAALEEPDWDLEVPVDRHRVDIDRLSHQVTVAPLRLSEGELKEAILLATGEHLRSYARHADGMLSVTYKISVGADDESEGRYILQLRHHGDVASMDALMQMISSTISPDVLPIPTVYPIPGEAERQKMTGFGRQVASFIPGVMASAVYPTLSHEEKLRFVGKLAHGFAALWQIPLPRPYQIGELLARRDGDDNVTLSVGPDRHHSLGGPFDSVRTYLGAYLTSALEALRRQEGIDEYKDHYLERITTFVESGMHHIPQIVENVPVVCVHADLGPHNIIVSDRQPTEINAIIDWEFVDSAPYATTYPLIERLFRQSSVGGWGAEYPRADELRARFWGSIPRWKTEYESEATRAFLRWFRFGLFMKPEPPSAHHEGGLQGSKTWGEHARVVEEMLADHPLEGQ